MQVQEKWEPCGEAAAYPRDMFLARFYCSCVQTVLPPRDTTSAGDERTPVGTVTAAREPLQLNHHAPGKPTAVGMEIATAGNLVGVTAKGLSNLQKEKKKKKQKTVPIQVQSS